MTSVRFATMLCAALLLASGCAPNRPPSPAAIARARELQHVARLKSEYKGVVMGVDAKGTLLSVFVDINGLDSMDVDSENSMQAKALQLWREAWSAAHPHRHATLYVRLRDYYGKTVYSEKTKV
ncbi:MAG: hypothetical protein ACYDEU_05235 [Vulcanimicrobiaceae bacterium]